MACGGLPGRKNQPRELILLRGVPGSGKTFLANQIVGGGVILSTDDYFIRPDGKYKFRGQDLGDAHRWNQDRCRAELKSGRTPVVIDNTNLTLAEMRPYAVMALQAGYYVHMREPRTPWRYNAQQCAAKTQHGVPVQSIETLLVKFTRDLKVKDLLDIIPHEERHKPVHGRGRPAAQQSPQQQPYYGQPQQMPDYGQPQQMPYAPPPYYEQPPPYFTEPQQNIHQKLKKQQDHPKQVNQKKAHQQQQNHGSKPKQKPQQQQQQQQQSNEEEGSSMMSMITQGIQVLGVAYKTYLDVQRENERAARRQQPQSRRGKGKKINEGWEFL